MIRDSAKPKASPITVRGLDEDLKRKLRVRAAANGHSMEEEVRTILRDALGRTDKAQGDLGAAIRKRFAKYGGIDLPPSPRAPDREPPEFGE
jgi:plasmid stability protein